MAIIPPYLKEGDTIALVCPAGAMPEGKADKCIQVLQQWGYKVKVGKTVCNQFNYFSGTDEERLQDLQAAFDDREVKAILCARGGYGTGRIMDDLRYKKLRKNPKWVIGFSDVTILHSHLLRKYKIASMHAPMASAFNEEEYHNEYVQSLKHALIGVKADYVVVSDDHNNKGTATGQLVGGNLSLLAHLTGTPSAVKTKGRILFIEDVGEYIYNVDRMLYQLKRSGQLSGLAGLIVGGFSDMKDTTTPFGKDVYEVIYDLVKEYNYPIAFRFPVSHEKENYALKVGVQYRLEVTNKNVRLKEL
jgi:muramoyltetrapeptide carboxypeptidase